MAKSPRPGLTTGTVPAPLGAASRRFGQPQPGPDLGAALVTDTGLNAQVQSLLPSVIKTAPPGFGAGPHGGGMNGEASSAWLTAALRARGVQLQDGQHVMPNGQIYRDPSFWQKYKAPILFMAASLAGVGIAGGLGGFAGAGAGEAGAQTAGGLGGFLGDGAVIGGVPAALPEAVASIPGAAAGGGALAGGTLPVAEGIATGPGAASIPGSGVNYGLLGPSMETPADLAFATGGGGVQSSLLGPTAPHAADVAAGAGSNIPSWLKPAIGIGAPLAAGAFTHAGNSNNTPGASPLDPETQGMLKNILNLSQQRLESTVPVHEAAMRLAMSMAPNGQYSPRMQQSIGETNQANPQSAQMSPNVQEAYRRLMQGNG